MTDQETTAAIKALAEYTTTIMRHHIGLCDVVANRMPGLEPAERKQLLKVVAEGKKQQEIWSQIVKTLD